MTDLDPAIVKSDKLGGAIVGFPGTLPPVWYEFKLETHLLDRVVGVKGDTTVEPVKKGEALDTALAEVRIEGIDDPLPAVEARGAKRVAVAVTSGVTVASPDYESGAKVATREAYGTAQTVPIDESHPLVGQSPYSASKIGADKLAESYQRTYGLPVVTVRPFNSYGPRQSARAVIPTIVSQALESDAVRLGNVSPTRDFTFVDDTVDGLIGAAQCDALVGDVVNIAFGREISIRRIAELLQGLIADGDREVVYTDPRPGDVERHFADTSKAKRLFDLDPKIEIGTGLARTVEWFTSRGISSQVEERASGAPNW